MRVQLPHKHAEHDNESPYTAPKQTAPYVGVDLNMLPHAAMAVYSVALHATFCDMGTVIELELANYTNGITFLSSCDLITKR